MIRKILKLILTKDACQKIEDESKKWFMECPQCGFSISYWEAGGVRAFASSRRKRVLGRCPKCKKLKLLKVVKKQT